MTSAAARRSTWTRSASGPERFPAVKESITRAVETEYRWRAWLAMSRRTSVLGTVLASSLRAWVAQPRSAASSSSFGPRGRAGGEKPRLRSKRIGLAPHLGHRGRARPCPAGLSIGVHGLRWRALAHGAVQGEGTGKAHDPDFSVHLPVPDGRRHPAVRRPPGPGGRRPGSARGTRP